MLSSVALSLGANGDEWGGVALHHVEFAKRLADEGVRYGPDFDDVVGDSVVACEPIDSKLTTLGKSQQGQINLFCEQLCMPWLKAWSADLEPCDQDPGPRWCRDFTLAGKHLGFGPYFQTLTAAIRDSTKSLERYNIMAVMADSLTKKVLRDYPHRDIDTWTAQAVDAYLERASGDDVLLIARQLAAASLGKRSAVAKRFRTYSRRSANLTAKQREELQGVAQTIGD